MDIEFIKWLVTGGLGGAVISFLLKSWFESRLKNSIKHEYDSKLLELKNTLDKDSAALAVIQNHYRTTNAAGHDKVLNAISYLWNGMVELRKIKPSILTISDLLVESEFGEDFGSDQNENIIDITENDINNLFSGKLEAVNEHRLFAGELIYSYFYSYQRIIGRVSIVIKKGRVNKNVPLWWEDDICKSVISAVCNENEKEAFNQLKFQRINWLLNHIEKKFLSAANQIISGESSIDKAFEQSARIMQKYSNEELRGK